MARVAPGPPVADRIHGVGPWEAFLFDLGDDVLAVRVRRRLRHRALSVVALEGCNAADILLGMPGLGQGAFARIVKTAKMHGIAVPYTRDTRDCAGCRLRPDLFPELY